ncbi:MAG: hypothetical protein ACLSVD_02895 [Eggerthellaceae bacterium]
MARGLAARARFDDGAPQLVQRMCATGTAAWALHLRGVQAVGKSPGLAVSPQLRRAPHRAAGLGRRGVHGLRVVSQVAVRGELLTQVEVHRPNDRGDYEIMARSSRRRQTVAGRLLDGAISCAAAKDVRAGRSSRQPVLGGPRSHWLFDAGRNVETTELAFGNGQRLVLGRKMVMARATAPRRGDRP